MPKLLSRTNHKIIKGEKFGYKGFILHLAPYTLAGFSNVCPKATTGCIAGCLNTAGRGGMFKEGGTNSVQEARKRRTRMFFEDREQFMRLLVSDIKNGIKLASKYGLTPCFRLNGTSDISWEKYLLDGKNVFEHFPDIQFYDYTKVLGRKVDNISNYHLTFSRAESNDSDVRKALDAGMNIAIVFDKVPNFYYGLPVIDGDISDVRFNDPTQVVVGLKAKGRARKDTSGFVVRL